MRPEPSRFLLELPQDDLIWEQERKVVSAEEPNAKGKVTANLKSHDGGKASEIAGPDKRSVIRQSDYS